MPGPKFEPRTSRLLSRNDNHSNTNADQHANIVKLTLLKMCLWKRESSITMHKRTPYIYIYIYIYIHTHSNDTEWTYDVTSYLVSLTAVDSILLQALSFLRRKKLLSVFEPCPGLGSPTAMVISVQPPISYTSLRYIVQISSF